MQQRAVNPSAAGLALQPAVRGWVARWASPRLTLWLLGLLGVAVVAVGRDTGPPDSLLAVPLALLAANLAAAIATHRALRTQPALLAFHLALLAVVLLAAAGRMTYLKGSAELSLGETFSGALIVEQRGPLHRPAFDRAAFTNAGFTVDYEADLRRAKTRNRVAYVDAGGIRREAVIGDDVPLKLAGYRFYTTPNKGFAPEIVWTPRGGEPIRGTIHMPSFPAQLARQSLEWTPPGSSQQLTAQLEIEERIVDLEGRWALRAPEAHALVLSSAGERVELRPGDAHRFREGTLSYAGLRLWMGYAVFYDWTLPWLLAASLLAAAALAWHFASRFRLTPWHANCERRGV